MAACRSSSPAKQGPEAETSAEDSKLHGSLSTRYRGRSDGDRSDHDLFQVLNLDVGDAGEDRTTWHLMGRWSADLDGRHERDGDFDFFGLDDSYDSTLQGRLYLAHADVRDVGNFERVRAGRQWAYDTPEFAWFDGLAGTSESRGKQRTQFGLYGGVPVHAYESSPAGDLLAGTWLQTHPWSGARVRLDWMHLEDEFRLGKERDDLYAIGYRQALSEELSGEVGHSRLEGLARDVRARLSWLESAEDLALDLRWFRLLEPQGELTLELDPFFNALFERFPYQEAVLNLSKGFGEELRTEVGLYARRVEDDADVGEFNRDFDRGYLTVVLPELLPEEVVLAATLDRWSASASDVTTWGAELSREWPERYELALGSEFALFDYDWLDARERERVRTWYGSLRFGRTGGVEHQLRYEYEDAQIDDWHSLRWVMRWRF
jgi:hypothetical protein